MSSPHKTHLLRSNHKIIPSPIRITPSSRPEHDVQFRRCPTCDKRPGIRLKPGLRKLLVDLIRANDRSTRRHSPITTKSIHVHIEAHFIGRSWNGGESLEDFAGSKPFIFDELGVGEEAPGTDRVITVDGSGVDSWGDIYDPWGEAAAFERGVGDEVRG